MASERVMGRRGCTGRSKQRDGQPCDAWPVRGTDKCLSHGGKPLEKLKAEGAVRLEVERWALNSQVTLIDPGVVLLRLVTQSAQRADMLAGLLQDAYDAAERLRAAHEAETLIEMEDHSESGELSETQRVREDLHRIFATGGVAALVGNQYASTKDGDVFATGEAIRGLAKLEAEERDRCANFATKAIAAGLAERQVRLAERQGALLVEIIRASVEGLPADVQQQVMYRAATRIRSIEGGAA